MKTLDIAIRQADPRDAAAIADVHALSWRSAYCGIIPHKALTMMIARRGPDWWGRVIGRSGAVLVADVGGVIAGYVTYGRNRARQLTQQGEIYELYLLPEYQGIGLGTKLFDAARKALRAHDLRGLVVWALEDNALAGGFYEGLGGRDVAEGTETFDDKTLKKVAFVWNR
ncbi:MAG: GNAT family N-acetyltransferase [Rhizobiaceae bacterium]|jgi:ribosomal protein S18 acetylase RimI-like enzyme|nr:GNAT family N-acetyltransferase [Rhizobiaceae bacterium]